MRVRIHKPHAPIPGVFRDVYAETQKKALLERIFFPHLALMGKAW